MDPPGSGSGSGGSYHASSDGGAGSGGGSGSGSGGGSDSSGGGNWGDGSGTGWDILDRLQNPGGHGVHVKLTEIMTSPDPFARAGSDGSARLDGTYAEATAYRDAAASVLSDPDFLRFVPTEAEGLRFAGAFGFIPGVGEAVDVATLLSSEATGFEKFLAGASLTLSVFTFGFSPNFGGMAGKIDDVGGSFRNAAKGVARHGDEIAKQGSGVLKAHSGGVDLGDIAPVTKTISELRQSGLKDAHHVIQDAAVRDLPGYSKAAAPGVQLIGPPNVRGTPHYLATQVQRQSGGGTYAAERRIGYKALRRGGLSKAEARQAIQEADAYFLGIGVGPATPTRVPGNR